MLNRNLFIPTSSNNLLIFNLPIMSELKNQVVVITGGASGIGRSIAYALYREGSRVVLADLNEKGMSSFSKELGGIPCYCLDVTDSHSVQLFAERVEEEVGPVDILVNCAGVAHLAEAIETSLQNWEKILSVNLWGIIHTIDAFLPRMYRRKKGHIVNIASTAGVYPVPRCIAYAASKHGIVGLSETLALEGKAYGLRVTIICPNFTKTPMISGKSPLEERFPWIGRLLEKIYRDPDELADRVVMAIKKDQLLYIDSLPAKIMHLFHLMARDTFIRFNSSAYRRFVHLLMPRINLEE